MTVTTGHWTANSIDDFVYRIAADFVVQLEKRMESEGISQEEIAQKLGVTPGRVSQVLNNPGNLTIKKTVEYAQALGMKVSIVAYDDNDPSNNNGPVNSDVFQLCWANAGKPHDFFAIASTEKPIVRAVRYADYRAHRFQRSTHVILGRSLNIKPTITLSTTAKTTDSSMYRLKGERWPIQK